MRRADAVRPTEILARQSWLRSLGEEEGLARPERTCVDHDQQLHEAIIDVAWCGGLDDEDVLVSDGLAHCDTGFLVGVVEAHGLCDLDAQPVLRAMAVSILAGANHNCLSSTSK